MNTAFSVPHKDNVALKNCQLRGMAAVLLVIVAFFASKTK